MNFGSIILKQLFELTDSEKEMILEWRNNNNIRKWMYRTELISKKTHFQFVNDLKLDKYNKYFLVKQDKINIGVIYFNNIDVKNKVADFGLYVNPDIKVSGIGSILEKVCIEYAFDKLKIETLKLEVFSDNLKAINLYKKFMFKETDKKLENNKEVICMELKNENR